MSIANKIGYLVGAGIAVAKNHESVRMEPFNISSKQSDSNGFSLTVRL